MPPDAPCSGPRHEVSLPENLAREMLLMGCCSARCGSCPELGTTACLECRTGCATGERDISRARCALKVCRITRHGDGNICTECADFALCAILHEFYGKSGYKYRAYRRSAEYIRSRGRRLFLLHARRWTRAYDALGMSPSTPHFPD